MNPHQTFFLPHFLGKPTNISYLIFLGNPPIFLPHFLGKPTNFSYLIFLGNPPIFPTPFSWKTHQFFLPHFLGKPTNFSYLIFLGNPPIFLPHFFGKPTNFSFPIFLLNHQFFLPNFLGNQPICLIKLLKETSPHEVFGYYLCYQLEFLQAFHNEGRYHWYLQDNTSHVILSDKSVEKFKFENLKWCKPVPQARSVFSQNLQNSHRKWDLRVFKEFL